MKKNMYIQPEVQVSELQTISFICYSVTIGNNDGTSGIDTGGEELIGQ